MNTASSHFDVNAHVLRLQRDGYTIIEDFLSADVLHEVRAGLKPFLSTHAGRNNFEGYKTERIYTLVARGKIFERLTEEPRILALLDQFLLPGYLLTASQAICIHPGETPQPLHADDMFYRVPRPRPSISISTIVAVDAFTAENGGTEILPGSHAWGDAEIGGVYDGLDHDTVAHQALIKQLVPVRMPAGACVVFAGTLLHRGGANVGSTPRLAFSNQYCEPWARTQENFFLGVPPQLAREMSPRVQQLLGYSIWPPFMGQVTARHPMKALQPDWVAPVLSDPL